jgi:uncharacterized protein with ParB-like and HNH nuclease domain
MHTNQIKKLTDNGHYNIHAHWSYIETWLEEQTRELNLDIDPDFQRGHVWTEEQQTNFIEYCLRGGWTNTYICFNCVGWMTGREGLFVLVDGKQRLEAVRKFIRNELPVFGNNYINDFEDKSMILRERTLIFNINNLPDRKAVLQWYLDINTGGVVHTNEEIEKVKKLLEAESK